MQTYKQQGIVLKAHHTPKAIEKNADSTYSILFENDERLTGFDCIIFAIGRHGNTQGLDLGNAGTQCRQPWHDKCRCLSKNTNVPGIYAIGDVTGQIALTPVAHCSRASSCFTLIWQSTRCKVRLPQYPYRDF